MQQFKKSDRSYIMPVKKCRISGLALVAMAWSVTSQAKPPEGQVVAVVNGEEVTMQDVDGQLPSLPGGADRKAARAAALQQIVGRKLMAQEARQLGLDRDASFLAQKRRVEEELLLATFAKQQMEKVPVPDAAAITKFMADNPHMFANRRIYKLAQIQFDVPADPASLKSLEGTHSLDAAAQALTKLGVKFERGTSTLDSAKVSAQLLTQVLALPKNEPFIIASPQPGKGLINVITGSEPVSVAQAEQRDIAMKALRNQALAKVGEQRLAEAKGRAKIEYQAGFEPR